MYQVKSPLLFLIFNRPVETEKVFNAIRNARPTKLYVAADGARSSKNETLLCNQTRAIIDKVDWQCEVRTLFRHQNLGCKAAVSGAISWFFENEEEGIVLEDDCLPSSDFFLFMDEMLEKYRHDARVRHICGCNFQKGNKRGNASYYFSNISHVWGWASWRRVWNEYDLEMKFAKELIDEGYIDLLTNNKNLLFLFKHSLWVVKNGEVNTWDMQLCYSNFINNGLCIIPNFNLISNIGFGINATHTTAKQSKVASLPYGKIDIPLVHPTIYRPNMAAD